MCIICQKSSSRTCKVAFKETVQTMLSIAQKLSRLNTITHTDEAIVNDVLNPNFCWAKAK